MDQWDWVFAGRLTPSSNIETDLDGGRANLEGWRSSRDCQLAIM